MADWDGIYKLGQAIVNKVKLGSAVDGPLVIAVFMAPLCIIAYTIRPTRLLLYIAILGIGIYGLGYVYFMFKDPDKLRSEEHEQMKLQIASGLGESGKPPIDEARFLELSPTSDTTQKKPKEKE